VIDACLIWSRSAALLDREREALHRIAAELRESPWHALQPPVLELIEDHGPQRVMLHWHHLDPDVGLTEHKTLVHLANRVQRAVPASTLRGRDPLALVGRGKGGDAAALLGPPLPAPAGFPPAETRHPLTAPDALPPTPTATTAEELADILQLVHTVGPRQALLRAARPVAIREPRVVVDCIENGIWAGAAMELLRALAEDELPTPQGARTAAQLRWADGDRTERQAAAGLLQAMQRKPTRPAAGPPDGRSVPAIGEELLRLAEATSDAADLLLEPEDDELILDEDDLDWEDDLALAAVPEGAPGDGSAAALARSLPLVWLDQVAPLPGTAAPAVPSAAQVISLLDGSPEERAGVLVLLASGQWDPAALPGLGDALGRRLHKLQPPALQCYAAEALGRIGRRDTESTLLSSLGAPEPLASFACRALRFGAGEPGRRGLREALATEALRDPAAVTVLELEDLGAVPALRAAEPCDLTAAVAARLAPDEAVPPAGPLSRVWNTPTPTATQTEPPSPQEIVWAGMLGDLHHWQAVVRAARHTDPDLRTAAARALGAFGLRCATPLLVELAIDSDLACSLAAIAALQELGDQRAVPVLRRLATQPGAHGRAAHHALISGRQLRAPAPDGRVRLMALSRSLVGPDDQRRLRAALGSTSLELRFSAAGVVAEGHVDPERPEALLPVLEALQTLERTCPGLAWSARDGHGLLRRAAGRWLLSTRHGRPPRDAGWFSETLPAPRPRAPLAPLDPREDALLEGAARMSLPGREE
jgi:hypothetical protein